MPASLTIEDRIIIDAPAGKVWRLLDDVNGWSRWSVLYPSASGTLRVGEWLELLIALPGLKPQHTRVQVTAAIPDRRMEYASSQLGGLMHARRYIAIEQLGASRCEVANGEAFSGVLGGLVARAIKGKIEQGFAAMNQGLKQIAEAD